LIISTDLGGTLCGDTESMRKFNNFYLENHYFEKNNTLIYNTGRGYKSFLEMRKRENLLNPNYLITRCGCGIF
jgi:hydroxymethylpyrimidine pyrophosphatase-like HAD family hydrolase